MNPNDRLLAIAETILRVTSLVSSRSKAEPCPHGNLPSYPTHAWWCDDCWDEFSDATEAVRQTKAEAQP
jgi:hypothetical protein